MADGNSDPESNNLVTTTSLALSLSAPRAPPLDSAHRSLLLGENPSLFGLAHHHDHHRYHHHFRGLRRRIVSIMERAHLHHSLRLPHPHLPYGPEVGDQVTRALGVLLPMPWVNSVRDSGSFRSIIDSLITVTAPSLVLSSPSAAFQFRNLTSRCKRIKYGPHSMHVIDLFFPETSNREAPHVKPGGLVFFVHGGAWGSGLPWMYRLAALPFLELDLVVAIVGYRTYPDADAQGQVDDLELAASVLYQRYPQLCRADETPMGTFLMGHSSGAHIALLLLVKRAERNILRGRPHGGNTTLEFTKFIGMSGPYDIGHHYDYEAARGVEELSPMKPVCGFSREAFRQNSPACRLQHLLHRVSQESSVDGLFPHMLLIHGIEDSTVPFTASAEAARIVRSCGVTRCDEIYVARTGHQDIVMHLMLGGRAKDFIVEWIQNAASKLPSTALVATSRL